MSRKQLRSKFVKSYATETLATLTTNYLALEAAVQEGRAATSGWFDASNKLNNPSMRANVSDQIRDLNDRKYDYVLSVRRQREAFFTLCAAMDSMHVLLSTLREQLKPENYEQLEYQERKTVQPNFVESCHLYKDAVSTLASFGDLDCEWTLDCFMDEETKAAAAWFDGIPALPPRVGDSLGIKEHSEAMTLARALEAIENHNGGRIALKGGFLGGVMYASDTPPAPAGAVGIRPLADNEGCESLVAGEVASILVQKGWDAFAQNFGSGDLQINLPRGKERTKQRRPARHTRVYE